MAPLMSSQTGVSASGSSDLCHCQLSPETSPSPSVRVAVISTPGSGTPSGEKVISPGSSTLVTVTVTAYSTSISSS